MLENKNLISNPKISYLILGQLAQFVRSEVNRSDRDAWVAIKLYSVYAVFNCEIYLHRYEIEQILRDEGVNIEGFNSCMESMQKALDNDPNFAENHIKQNIAETHMYNSPNSAQRLSWYIDRRVNAVETLTLMRSHLCGLGNNFYSRLSFAFDICIATLIKELDSYKSIEDLVLLFAKDGLECRPYFDFVQKLRRVYKDNPDLEYEIINERAFLQTS